MVVSPILGTIRGTSAEILPRWSAGYSNQFKSKIIECNSIKKVVFKAVMENPKGQEKKYT